MSKAAKIFTLSVLTAILVASSWSTDAEAKETLIKVGPCKEDKPTKLWYWEFPVPVVSFELIYQIEGRRNSKWKEEKVYSFHWGLKDFRAGYQHEPEEKQIEILKERCEERRRDFVEELAQIKAQ